MKAFETALFGTAALVMLVNTSTAEEYDGSFQAKITASVGRSAMVGPIQSTYRPFVLEGGGRVEIDPEGNLEATLSGLRRADGIATYDEIFASLVCKKRVVANSDPFPVTDGDTISIDHENFVPSDMITEEECPEPIVLFRRNGCVEDAGCPEDDPSNKRWLAKSTAQLCVGSDSLLRADIKASPGRNQRLAGKTSSFATFEIDEGGLVEIDTEGNLKASLSGLVREDGRMTYNGIFASLVCSNKILKSTDAVAVADSEAMIEIYAENFVDRAEVEQCIAPFVLFRRSDGNKRWLAVSGFSSPL